MHTVITLAFVCYLCVLVCLIHIYSSKLIHLPLYNNNNNNTRRCLLRNSFWPAVVLVFLTGSPESFSILSFLFPLFCVLFSVFHSTQDGNGPLSFHSFGFFRLHLHLCIPFNWFPSSSGAAAVLPLSFALIHLPWQLCTRSNFLSTATAVGRNSKPKTWPKLRCYFLLFHGYSLIFNAF